jgi:carbon storage regulator
MLVLTRKINQKLIINDNIEVIVLESSKNTVKLGVRAPKGVHIYREEIYNEIKKSNKQATNLDIDVVDNLGAGQNQKSFDFMKKLQKND